MESSNPILSRIGKGGGVSTGSVEDLDALYNAPSATASRTGRMTIDDVVARTALDRKSTRLNSSHMSESRMPSSA